MFPREPQMPLIEFTHFYLRLKCVWLINGETYRSLMSFFFKHLTLYPLGWLLTSKAISRFNKTNGGEMGLAEPPDFSSHHSLSSVQWKNSWQTCSLHREWQLISYFNPSSATFVEPSPIFLESSRSIRNSSASFSKRQTFFPPNPSWMLYRAWGELTEESIVVSLS